MDMARKYRSQRETARAIAMEKANNSPKAKEERKKAREEQEKKAQESLRKKDRKYRKDSKEKETIKRDLKNTMKGPKYRAGGGMTPTLQKPRRYLNRSGERD